MGMPNIISRRQCLPFLSAPILATFAVADEAPTTTFMQIEGDKSQNITIDCGDISKAAKPLAFAA